MPATAPDSGSRATWALGARATPTTQIRKPRKLFFSKRCYCDACPPSSL